jgi:hypothetical protein
MCIGEYHRIRRKIKDEDAEALDDEKMILYVPSPCITQSCLLMWLTN